MRLVKNALTGDFELVPADSADIDTTGETQAAPGKSPIPKSFEYFNPEQKEKLEELESEFSQDMYSGA